MPTSIVIAIVYAIAYDAAIAAAFSVFWAGVIGALAAIAVSTLITSNRKSFGSGGFSLDLTSRTITQRDAVASWRVVYGVLRVGGIVTYMESTANKRYLHMVITLSGHELEEITTVYFDEVALTLDGSGNITAPAKYVGHARILTDVGAGTAQPFPDLVAESGGLWTDAHKQNGKGKLYVRLQFNADAYPNGIPNITALVKGKKVYDPRTATTVYSANAALCVADYFVDTKYGIGATYATDIDETALIAAANICDEDVTLLGASTEKRFECHGVFVVDVAPEVQLPDLLSSMSGATAYIAGKWVIYAGAYITPTLELTEDDLSGPIKISTRISKRALFNSVRGQFSNPDQLYQPADYPMLSIAAYVTEDNSEELWLEVDLPFTTSHTMAQRLSRIALLRGREQISLTLSCKLGAYRLRPGDTFQLTLSKYGWSQKVFEVIEVFFAARDDNALGIDLVARETNSAIFDWTAATHEQAMLNSPDTNLPDAFTVGTPGAPVIVEELYNTIKSSGVKARVTATWTVADDYFTQSGLANYQFEHKLITTSAWIIAAQLPEATYVLNDIDPGTYDFRVHAHNVKGVEGDYSGTTRQQIVGLTAPPTSVRSFSVVPTAGLAAFSWALHDDLDVRIGGKIEVRHSLSNSAYQWQDSALVALFDGLATTGLGPLLQGTYLTKARDTSNVYSNSVSVFYATEGLVTGFTSVASLNEDITFVGTKVNLQVTAEVLELTNPTSRTGQYYWPGSIAAHPTYVDLGSATARRFQTGLQVTRYDTGDFIDDRAAVDTWSSVDGGSTDAGEVTMFVRTTNDDPSSSPVWGNWALFRVAELNCRAAQFKLEYDNEQDTYNLGVTELSLLVKAPT